MATERTLVDSNILIDLLTENSEWFEWSSAALSQAAQDGLLLINPLIYAEVAKLQLSQVPDHWDTLDLDQQHGPDLDKGIMSLPRSDSCSRISSHSHASARRNREGGPYDRRVYRNYRLT